MKKSHIKSFLKFAEQNTSLNEEDFSILVNLFKPKIYKNKTHIVDPAEEKSSVFFICSGLVRYYYLSDDGKEWNKAFISENMMSTSFSKDFLGRVSPYGIQTLEETTLLMADFTEFESYYDQHPMIERLGRKLIEGILISKMNRERSFLQSSAKIRYMDFIEQNPDLVQRIPQYHLASYLGVTEVTLSRLASKAV